MGDWIKLPLCGKFLNLDRYAGPDLEGLQGIDKADIDYIMQQLGVRALHRATRIEAGPFRPRRFHRGFNRADKPEDNSYPNSRNNSFGGYHKARIR